LAELRSGTTLLFWRIGARAEHPEFNAGEFARKASKLKLVRSDRSTVQKAMRETVAPMGFI
jgi:hypothetical protein